jgi:16S rRNA (cytosine967-C5)-methyltransferase
MPPENAPATRRVTARPPNSRAARAAPPPGTRSAALDLLAAVFERRRPLEEALDQLPAAVEPRDRAAAHRLAAAVLRRTGSLDAVLEPFLRREPPPVVRAALRMGAAELLLLNTPAHAAVAATVAVVPRPFAGLVNAVLRKVATEGPAAFAALESERLDTPPWLWSAWHAAYGPAVRAIARAHQFPAALDLTLAPGATPPEGAVQLPTGSWRLPEGTRVTDLPGLAAGQFWVQDAAAALPARLLAVRPGERVADLCAAPGGKTAQLATAGGRVTAVERDPKRAVRLRENLARLQLDVEVVEADAATWMPDEASFDAILLDAPCSATGIIRRHPDIPHLKRAKDLPPLVEVQARLLAQAARLLRPGGRLVYATCSLQPEEGEAHLARAERLGLVPDPFAPTELPGLRTALIRGGTLRTRPDMWAEHGGLDGFFAARFRRA